MLEKDIKKSSFPKCDIVAKTGKELGQYNWQRIMREKSSTSLCFEGAVPFMAELIKHIDTLYWDGLMVVSSYGGGTVSSGEVKDS